MNHILTPDIEAQTLALLAMRILANSPGYPFSTIAFNSVLPEAYECLKATKRFLEKIEAEAETKADIYWKSEEGQKRREESRARFEELRKRHEP